MKADEGGLDEPLDRTAKVKRIIFNSDIVYSDVDLIKLIYQDFEQIFCTYLSNIKQSIN